LLCACSHSNTAPYALTPHHINSVFLPASDIPSFVGKGNVDLGITGHDVILEAQMEEHVTETLRLGFGKCSLQVQVPDAAPVHDVEALAGKRIVTSFEVLAGRFFADIDERAGLSGDACTQIEYVGGSVEAACALGLADAIGACNYPPNLTVLSLRLAVDLVGA
jgi:ATP phosphoribosyltransferase